MNCGNDRIAISLLMLPIGALGGFICGLIIVTGCLIVQFSFYGEPFLRADVGTYVGYILACGIAPGAMAGFLYAPIVYLLCLKDLDLREIISAVVRIATIIVICGLLGAVGQEPMALLAALVGAIAGFIYAADKYRKTTGSHRATEQVVGRERRGRVW